MTLLEQLIASACAGASIGTGALFIAQGNKMRNENYSKRDVNILLGVGTVVTTLGVLHMVNLLRK